MSSCIDISFVALAQAKVKERSAKIPGDVEKWVEYSTEDRVAIWCRMKDQGCSLVKALSTVLVISYRLMKALLQTLQSQASPFFAPLGTCLELECRGRTDPNFQRLGGLQQKFLEVYAFRERVCNAILVFFQFPPTHHFYVNEAALSTVSTVCTTVSITTVLVIIQQM